AGAEQHRGGRLAMIHRIVVGQTGRIVATLIGLAGHFVAALPNLVEIEVLRGLGAAVENLGAAVENLIGNPSKLEHFTASFRRNERRAASYVPASSLLLPPRSDPSTRRMPRDARCVTVGARLGAGSTGACTSTRSIG